MKLFVTNYKAGGLKNVDITNKIITLQCSWIRRPYGNSFHKWKLIPLYLIEKSFGTSLNFIQIYSFAFFHNNCGTMEVSK